MPRNLGTTPIGAPDAGSAFNHGKSVEIERFDLTEASVPKRLAGEVGHHTGKVANAAVSVENCRFFLTDFSIT